MQQKMTPDTDGNLARQLAEMRGRTADHTRSHSRLLDFRYAQARARRYPPAEVVRVVFCRADDRHPVGAASLDGVSGRQPLQHPAADQHWPGVVVTLACMPECNLACCVRVMQHAWGVASMGHPMVWRPRLALGRCTCCLHASSQ